MFRTACAPAQYPLPSAIGMSAERMRRWLARGLDPYLALSFSPESRLPLTARSLSFISRIDDSMVRAGDRRDDGNGRHNAERGTQAHIGCFHNGSAPLRRRWTIFACYRCVFFSAPRARARRAAALPPSRHGSGGRRQKTGSISVASSKW